MSEYYGPAPGGEYYSGASASTYYGSYTSSGSYYGAAALPFSGYYGPVRGSLRAQMSLRAFRLAAIAVIVLALIPGLIRITDGNGDPAGWVIVAIGVLLAVALAQAGEFVADRVQRQEDAERQAEREETATRSDGAAGPRDPKVEAAIRAQQEFLRVQRIITQAQGIAIGQARNAYRIAQISAGAGLGVLTLGILVTVNSTQTSLQLVAGGLAAVGSVTAGYVGATSLAVYSRALVQMNRYAAQPLAIDHVLRAHRISAQLSEGRQDDALEQVIATTLEIAADVAKAFSEEEARERPAHAGALRRAIERSGASTS